MRYAPPSLLLLAVLLFDVHPAHSQVEPAQTAPTPVRRDFHIRYVNNSNAYIDAGRDAGLAEGMKLVLKQDPTSTPAPGAAAPLEAGVLAKLTIVAAASSSAVCEVNATSRELVPGDVVSLPDNEVEKMVEQRDLGSTRQYPIVISFSEGDPLDEEVREAIPAPSPP